MNLDTTFNDFSVNNPSSGDLSTGSCVVEPTAANNRVCRTIFVHEPLPDVTAEVINRPDLLLNSSADDGVPIEDSVNALPDMPIIVRVSNIGEVDTNGQVWAELYADTLFQQRLPTNGAIPDGGYKEVTFMWNPVTNTNNLEVIIDNPNSFPCNANSYGCEREYNDQVSGVDNNESERELPDIDVAGISATKK